MGRPKGSKNKATIAKAPAKTRKAAKAKVSAKRGRKAADVITSPCVFHWDEDLKAALRKKAFDKETSMTRHVEKLVRKDLGL